MTLLLFTILVVSLALCYIYFSQKVASQRRKIIFLSYQIEEMKSQIVKQEALSRDLKIIYSTPEAASGETIGNVNLMLAPLESSHILKRIERGVRVEIIDSAELLGLNWYQVKIPYDNKGNNKGWVKKEQLNIPIEQPVNDI